MALPHEVYTPPGQAPRERSSMSMRRVRKLPYTEGFKPLSGGRGGNHRKSHAEMSKLEEGRASGLYSAMKAGGPTAVPPIHVDSVEGMAYTFGDDPEDYGNARLAVGNGGHRVAIANALNWKRIGISSNISTTGHDWGGGTAANYTPHPALSEGQFGSRE